MQTNVIEERDTWSQAFARLDAGPPEWLVRARRDAFAHFHEVGFPTVANEEWRYTNVAPIARTAFRPAAAESVGAEALAPYVFPEAAATLIFVNGRFVRELSAVGRLPDGTIAGSLAIATREFSSQVESHLARYAGYSRHPFVALNTAFVQDGAFVHVARGAVLAAPIHLLFLTVPGAEPESTHPRVLIIADRGSEATVVETHAGVRDGVYFSNPVSELVVGENATLRHWRIQRESDRAFHVGTVQVELGRSSVVHSLSFALGAAISRLDLNATLGAEGAEVRMNGLYVANGNQIVDHHTLIDHAQPNCASREVYKGILAGRSRGVFNGKVYVRPDAQKTDGKQTNRNLLLSDEALVHTKPQLEIFANDVKCTHGATIGQLDEDQIFYLRARGIAGREAKSILTHAFAGEILDQVAPESLRSLLDRALFARLPEA